MATTITRLNEITPASFNNKSAMMNASESRSPTAKLPIIKDETPRSSCPYTNADEKPSEKESSVNGVQVEPQTNSPTRSLSPEFLLGAPEKNGQKGNETDATDAARQVTCVYCNEIFPDKSAQDRHISTKHGTGKKVYDCSVCEKSFTHRSSRDIHLRVHTGLRPYECQFCKKCFRVSSHLRDHVRTHTGERPFKCSVCGRGFKQSSDMKKHRKTHFKSMPANPDTESATSYMIVRPEDPTTAVGQGANDLRSPADQRQNLKLVIKRERKSLDAKSTMPGDNKTKTISDNSTQPEEKPSGESTKYAETNGVITSSIETNTQWIHNSYENSMQEIRSTNEKAFSKSSRGKVTVKRKPGKGSKNYVRNGYKTNNSYPSMASGLGQINTSTAESANLNGQVSPLTTSQHNGQANSDIPTEKSPARHVQYDGNNLSYENRMTTQMENQNGDDEKNDAAFWQPESKRIKVEKLSPNSNEQPTHCSEQQSYRHEQATYDHDGSAYIDEQLMYGHETPTYYDEHPTENHELKTNSHEEPKHAYEKPTRNHELKQYTDQRPTESKDAPINIDALITANEGSRNDDVNSTPDMKSMNSVAKQQVDDSTYKETHALANTSTEVAAIHEDTTDAFPSGSEVATNNVTSETNVIARKPMVVKIRKDKIGTSFSVRKPVKLKDQKESVKCTVCEQTFSNLKEFTAHRCGKNGKTFRCNICNKIFARQTLLRQHMVLHQGSKRFRFKCNYCGRAFRHRSHLRDHERIHTGERPFKCSFCPKAFKQSSDHRKHENLHTGTTRYRCEKCSLDFKRCDALKRHAMMHTTGEVTLLKCEKCRSLFATADGHMSHFCLNKPYRYRCQVCPERFTDADDLRRHCYELHSEQSTLSCLKCEFCKLEFQNLEELDEHLGTHRLEKTHRCRTCGQRFSLLNQLVEHVKTHVTAPVRTEDNPPVANPTSSEPVEQTSCKSSQGKDKDIPPNVTFTSNVPKMSNKPTRPFYDFIPSRYQSLLHANSAYGEMAAANWARAQNFYLPVRSKDIIDGNPRRQDEAPLISPRDNPISSRPNTEVSSNNPMPSRSRAESYRSDAESYRRNTDSSEINTIPSESDSNAARSSTIADRPSTIATTVNANPQTSPKSNPFVDEFSSTSFAAYHAIALSRSSFRRSDFIRQQEPKDFRSKPTAIRNEPTVSSKEQTSNRDEPAINRRRTTYSMSNMVNLDQVSPRSDVTSRGSKVYRVNTNRSEVGNPDIDSEDIQRYPEEIRMNLDDMRRDPEEKRRNTEVIQLNSEEVQRCPEQTRRDSERFRRYPEEIRSNSDEIRTQPGGNRSNAKGTEMDLIHIQGNLTNGREHTIISEEHITHRRQRNGATIMTRQEVDSEYAKPQHEQSSVKRKYTCLNCRLEFYHESSLVHHVCDILSETLYYCVVCELDFESYEDLQVHMRKHWKLVVHFKCTLCGHRMRTEELLKEHNLKHLQHARRDRNQSGTTGDEDGYHWIADVKSRDDHSDPPETYITSPGSAKSVTSPVICSVSGNIVTKATRVGSERGHSERRSSNIEAEVSTNPSTELTSPRQHDDVITRSTHGMYVPYFEARKQAPRGYLNVFSQGPAIMSTMHAAMETAAKETSSHYPVANGLLYPPDRARSGFTVEHR